LQKNRIVTQTIHKPIRGDVIAGVVEGQAAKKRAASYSVLLDHEIADMNIEELLPEQKLELKKVLERRMKEAAKILDFEGATFYRDYLKKIS
jgi:excinuclease UvrABC helicase subunit UvrB